MNLTPFQPLGNQVGFLASTIAPAAVQAPLSNNATAGQVVITNTGSVLVFIVWGKDAATASINASIVAGTTIGVGAPCVPLFPLNQMTLTLPAGSFITGVTPSTIAACLAVPGEGA